MTGATFDGPIEVAVENVGGIDDATVTVEPGLTVLSGRNATNRTSFLRALMAVHGSDRASLKADADAGTVRLSAGGQTYERHFRREDGRVRTDGDPILDDPEVADLFAFLLESNEARRAVERGEDLREVIMQPVDTDAIQAEIAELSAERDRIDEELDELDGLERRATELEAERTSLRESIEETEADLRETRAEVEAAEGDPEATRAASEELERKLDDLWETRSTLEDVEYDLETERESLESLQEELDELQAELDSIPEPETANLETIEDRIETLRRRKESLDTELDQLQNVVRFNEDVLDGTDSELFAGLSDESDHSGGETVTDRLVADDESVVCWTCGEQVQQDHVQQTLDRLRSLRQERLKERSEVDEEIDRLTAERDEIEARRSRREEVRRTIREREREIERREETVEDLQDERAALTDRVEDLESTVEELREDENSEVLDRQEEANRLAFELESLEDDLAAVEAELASIEDRLADSEDLERRRNEIQSEIEARRSTVRRLENEAVESFNDHMESLLDRLEYANLERVWIERTGDGRTDGSFDLHVVRASESGTVYEDSIDHLSESEREVIGLTFALAGYLAHDVHETVPFMVLDSLEAVDSERIADLVGYLNDYAENLVVALLPEDAAALSEEYERVTEI